MPVPPLRRIRGTAVLLVLLAGCDSPAAPEPVAGRYVLAAVDGAPLPAVLASNAWTTTEVLADTLWLEEDGTGTRRVTYRSATAGEAVQTYRFEESLTYARPGGRIEITIVCDDAALALSATLCLPPPHILGFATRDRLAVRDLLDNRLIYRRR